MRDEDLRCVTAGRWQNNGQKRIDKGAMEGAMEVEEEEFLLALPWRNSSGDDVCPLCIVQYTVVTYTTELS
jgi:hypothetical protein